VWHSVKELYFSTTATARYHNERQPYPSKLGLLPSWLGLGGGQIPKLTPVGVAATPSVAAKVCHLRVR